MDESAIKRALHKYMMTWRSSADVTKHWTWIRDAVHHYSSATGERITLVPPPGAESQGASAFMAVRARS